MEAFHDKKTFSYEGVQLKDGISRRQFEDVLAYFLRLPEDDMLYGFRKRAGLPSPGNELGGWYSNDGSFNIYDWDEIFNPFGQWLSFFAKAYRITGRQDVYQKLKYLIHEWGKTIEKDGYFFYSWNNNAHHYSYEKILCGLVDAYAYAGVEEAQIWLHKITVWAKENLAEFKNAAGESRETFTGGELSIKAIDNEWYTLPENLYRAYEQTGEKLFYEFAQKWHYDSYWRAMREGHAKILKNRHGYSHVNTLCSAAMAYQVTRDPVYLETIKEAYRILQKYQVMASGGYAFDEHMGDTKGSNYTAVEKIGKSFEAPCGTYAVLKLTRYLLMFTGEAQYGDWAERVLYNAAFASLPMKDDGQRRGKTFYYADYRIGGGRKVYYEHSFPCCSGTYPQVMAEYHNMIAYYDDAAVYLAQYLPSEIRKNINDQTIWMEIEGTYPETEQVSIRIRETFSLSLYVRIPSWVREKNVQIEVNGKRTEREAEPGSWLNLGREWKKGDQITVTYPMKLYTIPITEEHTERAALMYGPVMLAAQGRHFEISADAQNPEKFIAKIGNQLEFQSLDGKIRFYPYWKYGEKEWNTVYLDYIGKGKDGMEL